MDVIIVSLVVILDVVYVLKVFVKIVILDSN